VLLVCLSELAAMDKQLLGNDEFAKLAKDIAEDFGTAEDDKQEKNDKLEEWLGEDGMGDVNFYTCTVLLVLDPNQEYETFRSNFKMFLLPAFQVLVPFGMAWYFLVQKALIANNGYCCNHSNYIFRFTGFVTFMYSAWQIIDGCDDASSKFFLDKSVQMYQRTGRAFDFRATWMFYLGHVSQQLCSFLLLVVTYVIYTSQCDTPLDLLMNCVAINFVLDIDSEWMGDKQQAKAKISSEWLFKQWRDTCINDGAEIKRSMKHFSSLRASAPSTVATMGWLGDTVVWVSAYILVFAWTFCPPSW